MRKELAKFLKEKMDIDERVCLVTGDCGQSLFDNIIKSHPNRIWNFGITEQSSIAHLSGMSRGLKPWYYSITPFALERPYEFIKLDLVSQNANVKVVGYWAYENDGVTHKTQDVKGTCKQLGIKLYQPKDSKETREFLEKTYNLNEPAFISLGRDLC